MIVVKFESDRGELLGILTANEHVFKTGSRGFFGVRKIKIAGKGHQCQVNVIEIGSKPDSKNGTSATAEPAS